MLIKNPQWNPKIEVIQKLIHVLYDFCPTGGLCHIVTDDYNIEYHHLQFVIKQCKEEPDEIESELCILICELLLKLDFEQRALLFSFMHLDIDLNEETWNKANNFSTVIEILYHYYGIGEYENVN